MNTFVVLVAIFSLIAGVRSYSVSGNQILDGNGKPVILRGLDRCSLEWEATGQYLSLSDYQLMKQWGANVIRLSLNQDYYLAASTSYASSYSATIQQQVTWIKSLDMGVILDLHWSDGGNLAGTPGQQCMADVNSITFWQLLAAAYANDSMVIYELYNEPHDVSWPIWLSGGSACGYQIAGMQQLYDAVRSTGADNLVLIGGLNYAYDLSGVADYPVNGYNIAYSTHPYDTSDRAPASWDSSFGYLTPNYPVVATEFGQYCLTDTYVEQLLAYFQTNGVHWTAWAWWVQDCSFPSLISDWNGTPLAPAGTLVYAALGGNITGLTTTGSTSGSSIPATQDYVVYTDSLLNGWTSYGWAPDLVFNATSPVYAGTDSISFSPTSYAAAYLHQPTAFDPNSYQSFNFYINGGTGSGQLLKVLLYDTESTPAPTGSEPSLPVAVQANTWVLESIPISQFGIPSGTLITGFAIEAATGNTQPPIFIDNISFIAPPSSTTSGTTGAATSGISTSLSTSTTSSVTTSSTPSTSSVSTSSSTSSSTSKSATSSTSGSTSTSATSSVTSGSTPSSTSGSTPTSATSSNQISSSSTSATSSVSGTSSASSATPSTSSSSSHSVTGPSSGATGTTSPSITGTTTATGTPPDINAATSKHTNLVIFFIVGLAILMVTM